MSVTDSVKALHSQGELQTQNGYDQTQSSAQPCDPRPKIQGLDGSSSALQSGRWSGDGLIRGQFGLNILIIGGFERIWV